MLKRRWRHLLALLLLIVIAVGLLLWSRPAPQASLDHRQLPDGSAASLANPGKQPNARVLLAVQADQKLDDAQLLALAHDSGARVVQFVFPENDCKAQQARIQAAGELLDGQPTLVAGIGPGSAWAFRWLAGQTDDKAKALSVGFSLEKPDCAATPLPQTAPHGHWLAAWNDNPDDASARFARGLKNAETVITDYDTPLPKVLADQLRQQLQGGGDNVPVVEVPAAKPSETVTLFYSGDGGWRDLDRDVAAQMAELGYPVVGVDALRYFWEHKTPEQSAADLALLMQHYREKWGAKHFVLAGYSFGADVLPAIYNRLPADAKKDVSSVILLAFARSGSFEIEVQGWLGKAGQEASTARKWRACPDRRCSACTAWKKRTRAAAPSPRPWARTCSCPAGTTSTRTTRPWPKDW